MGMTFVQIVLNNVSHKFVYKCCPCSCCIGDENFADFRENCNRASVPLCRAPRKKEETISKLTKIQNVNFSGKVLINKQRQGKVLFCWVH